MIILLALIVMKRHLTDLDVNFFGHQFLLCHLSIIFLQSCQPWILVISKEKLTSFS